MDRQFTHIGFAVLRACGDRPDKSLQNCTGHWFRKSGPKKIKVFRPSPIDRQEECMNFQQTSSYRYSCKLRCVPS